LDFAVRYPFSDAGRAQIKEMALTERIVELGKERIRKAIRGDSSAKMLLHESDKKEDIASFAAARMILSVMRNRFLIGKFSVNESKRARAFLDRSGEAEEREIAGHFGISVSREGKRLTVDLPVFVSNCPRSVDYRLINRRIVSGRVDVKEAEVKRLIEEAVRKRVADLPVAKDPPDIVKKAGEELLGDIPKAEGRPVINAEDHPPCITKILESADKHENLPHQARWYLATYMLNIGMKEEAVAKMFTDMPDYNERTTTYQVSQIARKGYSAPACPTIVTFGLCVAQCNIGNPLNWHKLGKDRKERIRDGSL